MSRYICATCTPFLQHLAWPVISIAVAVSPCAACAASVRVLHVFPPPVLWAHDDHPTLHRIYCASGWEKTQLELLSPTISQITVPAEPRISIWCACMLFLCVRQTTNDIHRHSKIITQSTRCAFILHGMLKHFRPAFLFFLWELLCLYWCGFLISSTVTMKFNSYLVNRCKCRIKVYLANTQKHQRMTEREQD